MIRNYWNEKWKVVLFDDKIDPSEKYKISNYGRILNCKGKEEFIPEKSFVNGYEILRLKLKKNQKWTCRYIHKLVAQHFMPQDSATYVIHLNYDKTNNRLENLKWATKEEKEAHQFSSPQHKARRPKITNSKLTETKVKLIKRKLNDPNRRTRLKMIAKQFGISQMQLYRIKTGENWGSVTEY